MPISIAEVLAHTDMEGWKAQERLAYEGRVSIINYLSSLKVERSPEVGLDLIGNFVIDTTAVTDACGVAKKLIKDKVGDILQKSQVLLKVTKVAESVSTAIHQSRPVKFFKSVGTSIKDKVISTKESLIAKLEKLIQRFCSNILDKLKKAYKDIKWVVNYLTDISLWLVSSIVGDLSSLIPGLGYVQNAADIYKGAKKAVTGLTSYFSMKLSGRSVRLNSGYPDIIAYDISSHMACKGFLGIKDVGVKIGQISAQAAGDAVAAVGSVINYVINVLGRIATAIDYIIQRVNLYRVKKKAKIERDKLLSANSIARNADSFSEWFAESMALSPILTALLMHSNTIAHPMVFLSLVDRKGRLKGYAQSNFEKGSAHINNIKKHALSYIKEYTGEYSVKFTPSLQMHKDLLDLAMLPTPQIYTELANPYAK
ncbi:hypothetical protein [Vibrio splendidus]|jgi:hypothetical protein|uniref:hypothetical protein n=1 Tax=Vibrio splendidus TaxID=29497 RepID=UPI00006701ED|nr:hypothetical protein [Vibrio splendidus]EAP94544.1 hypothetical protein V12B01_14801 [Vibrio splendidus 12B01]OCH69908.1 hypothetical protein A6D94_03380 [Vibrio splendidus]PMH15205.1 hypothetical protein BCU77_03415 [Vibrio splendidus]PMI24649.1 hypothetical protein BCU48_08170 [Vibrio splendidus]PMM36476.1 hypothetical protein BCT55_13120 [Vibrio splendidus]